MLVTGGRFISQRLVICIVYCRTFTGESPAAGWGRKFKGKGRVTLIEPSATQDAASCRELKGPELPFSRKSKLKAPKLFNQTHHCHRLRKRLNRLIHFIHFPSCKLISSKYFNLHLICIRTFEKKMENTARFPWNKNKNQEIEEKKAGQREEAEQVGRVNIYPAATSVIRCSRRLGNRVTWRISFVCFFSIYFQFCCVFRLFWVKPNVSFSWGFPLFLASRIPHIFFRAISSCISTFIEYFRQKFIQIKWKYGEMTNILQEFHWNCCHFGTERSQWAKEADGPRD
jgi:hypothetical protein